MTDTATFTSDLVRAFVEGTPPASGPIRVIGGSAGMKRDGRDYRMSGLDLTRYRSNPVVLWNHDMARPPIGRGEAEVIGDRLMIDVTFDSADPFAAEVEAKYRRGFLNAMSMLAVPTDGTRRGVVKSSELVEVSTVTVPVDASAVVTRRAMARLGRELIDLAGPDEDDDVAAMRSLLSAIDDRRQVDQLRTLSHAFDRQPSKALERRIKRAVRTALREGPR